MSSLFKSKGFLGLIFIFILVMFVYNTFLKTATPAGENDSALVVGQDLIKLSDDLSKAQLSQELFTLPGYVYLTDFSAPIPQEPLGRVNPFDIIGR